MRASIEIEIIGKGASPEVIAALHKIAEDVEDNLRIELDRNRDGSGGEVRAAVRIADER
jgi:hypothetical protein